MTHRVRDIVDSRALGYRYDDVPNPAQAATVAVAMAAPSAPASHASQAAAEQPIVAASSAPPGRPPEGRPLGLKTETIELRPRQRAVQAAPAPGGVATDANPTSATAAPERILVSIEGIAFDRIPDITYGVYVNVPEGLQASEATREHLVGVLNFFGKDAAHARVRAARPGGHGGGHHGAPPPGAGGDGGSFAQTFDATKVVARLRQKGLYREGARLRIDLRPLVPEAPRGAEAATSRRVEASAQQANVRYQDVKLLVSP